MANQRPSTRPRCSRRVAQSDGDYYGLPWPCWGTPEMKHPGTPVLYDTSKPVAEGGLELPCPFRCRSGKAPTCWPKVRTRLATSSRTVTRVHHGYADKAWLGRDLTADERAAIEQVAGEKTNWKTDLSGGIQRVAIKHGCAPFGNAKARTVVWTFPDPVPLHREPLYTPRRDLLPQYETYRIVRCIVCRPSTPHPESRTTPRTSRSF